MKSCIYAGWVRHRRFKPVPNAFRYRIFMMYLDLAELDQVFRGFWLWSARRPALAWFRRRDHFGDAARPLDACIRDLVAAQTGMRPDGPIRLLTHLRYFGYCFNPVSFYYCHGRDGRLQHIVLEVNNTPWGETHCYVLPADDSGAAREHYEFEFDKAMHVSPFQPMDMRYRCRVNEPAATARIGIENWRAGEKAFDAHLVLNREPITHGSMARQLAMDPLITLRVMALIMWQAWKLWRKKAPVYTHRQQDGEASSPTP
jgi:hypothetical protein